MKRPAPWIDSEAGVSARGAPLLVLVLAYVVGMLIDATCGTSSAEIAADTCHADHRVVVLLYHRFAIDTSGDTTVRLANLQSQITFLTHRGYEFRPLWDVVRWRMGAGIEPPCRTAVFTVDDDNRSTYELLLPVARASHLPVTLFIYPSATSNASYALTWDQLRALHATGWFDVQSHTLWHPNFKTERRRLPPDAFRAFAITQLAHSKARLEERVGGTVDLVAWPFGIHDDELERIAADQGYVAGFGIDERLLDRDAPLFALPRVTRTRAMPLSSID